MNHKIYGAKGISLMKLLPCDVLLDGGVNPCTKFGGTPSKFEKAKNVQNLARFRTTFDFDGKYLSNELRYRQAVNGVINYRFFRVEKIE